MEEWLIAILLWIRIVDILLGSEEVSRARGRAAHLFKVRLQPHRQRQRHMFGVWRAVQTGRNSDMTLPKPSYLWLRRLIFLAVASWTFAVIYGLLHIGSPTFEQSAHSLAAKYFGWRHDLFGWRGGAPREIAFNFLSSIVYLPAFWATLAVYFLYQGTSDQRHSVLMPHWKSMLYGSLVFVLLYFLYEWIVFKYVPVWRWQMLLRTPFPSVSPWTIQRAMWWTLNAVFVLPTLYISLGAVHWLRLRRIPPGHCKRCGYNLTGNVSGVCSECGEPCKTNASAT